MIEVRSLRKIYGTKVAVDNASFTVHPGVVTGFLGPNGAGKSTTMRAIVGLDRPTSGSVLVNGKPYANHKSPLTQVGALLDAKAIHTGRSAYNHLRAMAATHNIPNSRVTEVMDMTGLQSVAKKRVGGFSLGMGQRLGIACALLGNPETLILDEPVNGLDPEGVIWVRELVRALAAEGRTIFLSSHLMSEMAVTADHLIIIGRGKIIANASVAEIVGAASGTAVRVRSPHASQLETLLRHEGADITALEPGLFQTTGLAADAIGNIAAAANYALHELTPIQSSLESAYLELTANEVEYHSSTTPAPALAGGEK